MDFIKTCESIFNEIQQLRRDYLEGKITAEAYSLQMGGISQLEKQQKLMIGGTSIEHRMKKKLPVDLNKGVLDIRKENIECPDIKAVITRERCLDYSGEEKNYERCKTCDYFKINRDLLLAPRIK